MQANVTSVYSFRPIFEHSCLRWCGNILDPGASVTAFVAMHLQPGVKRGEVGMRLTPESKGILDALGVSAQEQEEVALVLNQLYFKLIKSPIHAFPKCTHPNGFVLGGPRPVRFATALMLLKLQEVCHGGNVVPQTVLLLNNHDKVTHVLSGGKARRYKPQP